MQQFNGIVRDVDSVPVSNAQVFIYDQFGELAALFYGDEAPLLQPVNTNEAGYWEAWIDEDGYYTTKIHYGGRERYVEVGKLVGVPADPLLRSELASDTPGEGAALVSLQTGETVEEAVQARPTAAALAGTGGAGMVGVVGGDTVQETLDAKANLTLANSPNVNASLTQDALTYPIGNELETYSRFNVFATDSRDDKREFTFNFCANFSHGPTGGGPYEFEDHKALFYGGVSMHTNCKKAWVLNPLLTIKEDCVDPQFVVVSEIDINNFNKHFGAADGLAGLSAPSCYGQMIAGSGALGYTITAAHSLVAEAPIFNRGYMVGPNSVVQAAFDDYSSATSSYRDSGSHGIGINLKGTYSSAAIDISGAAPAAVTIGGNKSVASILDSSVTPVGIALNGTYSLYLLNSPVFRITAAGRTETSGITFTSLPGNYANDAAAASGGVPVGGLYRNGSVLMVRVA